MRLSALLPLAATTTAFVLPDIFEQIPAGKHQLSDASESWLSSLHETFDQFNDDVDDDIALLSDAVDAGVEAIFDDFLDSSDEDEYIEYDDKPHRRPGHGRPGGHPRHPHGPPTKTIYEFIKDCPHTTKFAELVSEHDDLVDLLNSTKANSTLFVPIDKAFDMIPPDHKKPSKDHVEKFIKYHLLEDAYPVRSFIKNHTLPTALKEGFLGGMPQRLRVRARLFSGIHVNVFSKILAKDIPTTNGVVHFVNHFLIPPPMAGKDLSLLTSYFSTLLHAYEKTDFVKYIHNIPMTGTTVFAPSNSAFARLGPAANAFLFNTERGLKCLTALLKYQIVANVTLYSDAVYDSRDSEGTESIMIGRDHYRLETLLPGKSLSVNIFNLKGWITGMYVNKKVRVKMEDILAKNGVVHWLSKVPIPPHPHHKPDTEFEGEISAEDLEAILSPYIVEDADELTATGEL